MSLGIPSTGAWLAYVLSIASTLLCVIYGLLNWNKGAEVVQKEDHDWAKEEKEEVDDTI